MTTSTINTNSNVGTLSVGKVTSLHHLKELRASGLTDETIIASGIYSECDSRRLASMLNRKSWPRRNGYALVFPHTDSGGNVVYYRVKPDNPPEQNGRKRKYLAPAGQPAKVYFPLDVRQRIEQGAVEIIVTEGEKKSLAATQAGFCCLSIPGVASFSKKRSLKLLPDLDQIQWKGRTVFIAFDSDAMDNAEVRASECVLADRLTKAGAIVKVVRLPAGPNGDDGRPAKMGLDDFLVAHGSGELRELMDNAEPPEAPDPETMMSPASDMDPASEAGRIISASSIDGVQRIRYWRGSLWWWSAGRYVEKPDDEVRAEILNRLNQNFFGVKRAHALDVLAHVQAKSLLRGELESPAWLDDPPLGFVADECLATKGNIVHLPSLVSRREPSIVPSGPVFFTPNAVDFDINMGASRPSAWLEFLDEIWGDDVESISVLQEWFGYSLTADTRQQKVLIVVGPKRSGKGTIARVLTGIVGKGNVAAPTLAGLATNFGLWPLIGKSLAIISDARLSGRADQVAVVERLLSISGEDSTTVDRKNMQPLTCRLGVRFVILTNELPRLSDASGAIVSRMILLRMTRSFYGKEDHGLTDQLLAEREGILLWAIEGWRRLRERGRFVQPDSGLEALGEMSDLASPVAVFVRDHCDVGPSEAVVVANLFAAWQRWCRAQGREKFTGTVQTFARDLLAAEPGVRKKRVRDGDDRTRIYEGIGLKQGF